ncbi:MAG: histidine kinase, partial [Rhizobacter sp.]|nr:histidine kinase [Rhizobacter sp.]
VRRAMHLHCARRLDASGQPDVRLAVASHYAEVAALLDVAAPRERAIAAHHFDHAAALARGTGNIESAAHFLTLARQLRPPDAWQREPAHTFSLDVSWHAVLCSLGRHAEADTVYAELVRRAGDPLQLVDPTCMQAQSLSSRQQYEASVQLGIALLGRLGIEVPAQAVAHAEAQLELDHFEVLARELPLERLVNAPHATAAVSATARLMSHLSVAAFFFHPETAFWLVLRCCRLWAERGFCEDMITPLAGTMLATIGLRDDYRTGWRAVQVAIETARQRAVGPAARRVYKVHGLIACHWFEPLEQAIPHARVAYDQLMKSGDFETACHACFISQTASLEVASHLDLAEKEIDAALQLAARTSNGHAADSFSSLRQFTRALRGDTDHFGSFCDAEFDETRHIEATRGNPTGAAVFRIYRAWSACLFFDTEALAVHVAAALPLKGHVTGFYPTVLLRVATCLSTLDRMAAWPAATRQGDPAFASLSETLTHHLGWLERRAADMPANFAHLLDWVEARRAACEQRHWDAACRFDVAMRRSGAAGRTLHHAMIVEQAGRFHLQGGLPSTGEHLLRKALAIYRRWGARGKALQLEQRFAFLGPTAPAAASTLRSSRSSPADIDRLAILRASQALSSETDLDRLVSQIVEVIAQLSGATGVCLLFRDDRTAGWAIVGGVRDGVPLPGLPQPTDAAAQLGLASSVVRYALRTLETEVIDDVCHDERFMHDPALAGARACSMLLMPVLSKGVVQAVLLLENRLALRFFTAEHLELLRVITSQLSISIENALLYRSLERRVADRTEALQRAAGQLMLRERALASSANGVIITDMTRPGMPIIYVNAMFEQITGYTADEALGRSASFLEGDDTDQPDARVLHDAIAAHRSCKVLLRNYRKDGSMFWNELSVAPVRDVDGLVTHFVDIQVDVTERIAAQESGRLRTERLNAVFDLSPDGFVLLDSEERVSIVNPAFERMTGLLAGDLLGLDRHAFEARLKELCGGIEAEVAVPPQFAETQPPAMWEGFDPTLPEAPSAGLARQGLLHLLKPQPRALLRRVRRGPVHVDERAGREGDRRSSARGPETVMYFRDMTRELEIDQMKSDFLSTAAHELRTPMTSIFGFTELLIRRRLSDAQREDLLGTIHRQAGTLINLINELLDLARIEARRGKDFRPKLQPLQPLVRGMLAGLMIQDDPRTVQVVMRTGPAWVNVDADKLSLALTNVVSNAYKYSVAGDITLTLVDRTREGRAEVGVRVTDQGIGMTAQQLSRLFERFFRADTSGRIPGTGLGTTIVKEVVELHGGQVEVDSKPGVGTAFTVWLPLHAAPSTEALTAMPVSPDLLRLDFGNAPSSRTR